MKKSNYETSINIANGVPGITKNPYSNKSDLTMLIDKYTGLIISVNLSLVPPAIVNIKRSISDAKK